MSWIALYEGERKKKREKRVNLAPWRITINVIQNSFNALEYRNIFMIRVRIFFFIPFSFLRFTYTIQHDNHEPRLGDAQRVKKKFKNTYSFFPPPSPLTFYNEQWLWTFLNFIFKRFTLVFRIFTSEFFVF